MKRILFVLLALAPSLWFAYIARGVPHLGYFHDDGIYVGTASAIADGKGPRVESLSGEPLQVRYPPLLPLFLAPGAKHDSLLAILLFLTVPGLLAAVYMWRPEPLLVLLTGWNCYTVLLGNSAMSEVLGTIWLVLAIALLEREQLHLSAIAMGAAYLTRTALVVGPAGAVLWLLYRRRWRDAVIYGAIFAPVFIGWNAFVAFYSEAGATGTRAFYSAYAKFFAANMSLDLVPAVLSTNFPLFVAGAAGLLFFNGGTDFWEVNFARLLLFAAIAGIVRRARAEGVKPFDVIGVIYAVELSIWNYIPHERFLFPMLPLLVLGFIDELRAMFAMFRKNWLKQRGAVIVLGGLVAAGLAWTAHRNLLATWQFAPSVPARYHATLPDRDEAYRWIAANTPPDANFLASEEPSLRRATGRHGIGFHFPTRLYYENNNAAIVAYHRDILPRMRDERLQYLLIGPYDLELDVAPGDRERILRQWRELPELETVYENRYYQVRKLR